MHVILEVLSKKNPVLFICNLGALAWQYGRSTQICLGQKKQMDPVKQNLNISANSVELLTHAHVS